MQQGDAQGVPIGQPVPIDDVMAQALRQLKADTKRTEDRFRGALHRAGQHELDRLTSAGLAAQARVSDSVSIEIARQLPTALGEHIANNASVEALCRHVENVVEARAEGVVQRCAREEVARRALASAIEARVVAKIDERTQRAFLGGALLGAVGGVAAALLSVGAWRRQRGGAGGGS